MVTVSLKKKNQVRNLPSTVEVGKDAVAHEVISVVARASGLSPVRVRLTVKVDPTSVNGTDLATAKRAKDHVLQPTDKLSLYMGGSDDLTIYVRDLGPQLAWRTVFLLEYLGPLLIQPIFFFGQKFIYGAAEPHTLVQKCVFGAVMAHYLKRELETAFLHKFSMATMPLFNLFKNCAHYWLLSGVLLGYFTFAPASWATAGGAVGVLYANNLLNWGAKGTQVLMLVWLIAELSNFSAHVTLASLRPAGSTVRKIPYGFYFNFVSCPNYFWEAIGWLVISVLTGNWAVTVFYVVGAVQMYFWAIKKHRRYRREFPDYPKQRKAMIPFVV